jgi:hypothetical protein
MRTQRVARSARSFEPTGAVGACAPGDAHDKRGDELKQGPRVGRTRSQPGRVHDVAIRGLIPWVDGPRAGSEVG